IRDFHVTGVQTCALPISGAFVWGLHVLLVSFFVGRHDAIRLAFLQFVTCAVVSLILAAIFEETRLDLVWLAMPSLIYGGVFAVKIGRASCREREEMQVAA